jgi:3-methyladenine DNA glycosylase AlkD/outer membrane protein assembly factor BamB
MSAQPTQTVSPPAKTLLLWPAVVALALYWTAHVVVPRLETFYFIGFLAGLGSTALLAIFFLAWWWFGRRLPLRNRLYGFLLVVGCAIVVEPFCHRSIGWWGLLMSGLPIVMTAWVLWMMIAKKLPASWTVPGSVIVIALAFAYFPLIRMDGLDSNLRADVNWRWNPSSEDLFMAERSSTGDAADHAGESSRAAEAVTLRPGDWPEFRGPGRDGVIHGVTIATDWDTAPPRLVWRHRIGPAWSSVIVVAGRLYTQEQRGEQEAVVCYDTATGRELWAHQDVARFFEGVSGAGPRATPTFADGRIVALGATGILNCLDAGSSERRWYRNIVEDAGATPPQWGFSSSPLVTDGLVIVFAGGEWEKNLLAYRADTGEPAWTAPAGRTSYSSPQLVTLAGRRQCLMLSDYGLTAVDPASGAVLWKGGSEMSGAPRTVQPQAVGPEQLLVGTYELASTSLLDVKQEGNAWNPVPRWTSKDLKPEFPDYVVHQGHAYGFDVSIFCCIDLASGKRCWKEGRYGRGQVVVLADQGVLLVTSESGEAILLATDPQRHKVLGRFRALDGKTWNHAVIAHGRLYVRNAEEIACYEVALARRDDDDGPGPDMPNVRYGRGIIWCRLSSPIGAVRMPTPKPHRQFVAALRKLARPSAVAGVVRFFRADPNSRSADNQFLGVSIGKVFPVAKRFADMPLADVERLLDSRYYEVRMGAVSIMDFQARRKRTPAEHRKALFDLYIKRHDRINNWDLVDRAGPYVVGGYLADKPRDILYKLARSANPWERRTAIVSTYYFIRQGDIEDTFRIADMLVRDDHELVQKAVGSWVREAGKRDQKRLLRFLDAHARTMPRTMLRYAVEKLAPRTRANYLAG